MKKQAVLSQKSPLDDVSVEDSMCYSPAQRKLSSCCQLTGCRLWMWQCPSGREVEGSSAKWSSTASDTVHSSPHAVENDIIAALVSLRPSRKSGKVSTLFCNLSFFFTWMEYESVYRGLEKGWLEQIAVMTFSERLFLKSPCFIRRE